VHKFAKKGCEFENKNLERESSSRNWARMQQRTSRMNVKKEIIGKKEISWVPDQMVVTSSSTPSSTTPPDQTKKLLWFMQKGRRRPQQQMLMALKRPAIRRPRSSSRFTFSSSSSSTIFHGLRGMLICVSFGLVCITIATVLLCMREEEEVSSHPREITPFPTKLVSALPQVFPIPPSPLSLSLSLSHRHTYTHTHTHTHISLSVSQTEIEGGDNLQFQTLSQR
jgi:hypothetical protein